MNSMSDIRSVNDEAVRKAAEKDRQPVVLFSTETAFDDLRMAPFLGHYAPERWTPLTWDDLPDSWEHKGVIMRVRAHDSEVRFNTSINGFVHTEHMLGVLELRELARDLPTFGFTVGATVMEVHQHSFIIALFKKG